MRMSQLFSQTLREAPADAQSEGFALLVRAGFIRQIAAGIFATLPLGMRALRKIEAVLREEMNAIGGQELSMPVVLPADLWKETGRWYTVGAELARLKDRNERDLVLAMTHEEAVGDLVRREVQSYKQLPVNFYQIQTKFRDEIRPRFGVMRAREFIMKDSYSFHLTLESLQKTYQDMYQAYCRIFDRMGLKYRAVEADTGAIGGSASHEFQVLADSGEDLIFYSDSSDYAANIEQATSFRPEKASTPTSEAMRLIDTPNQKTIAEVAKFLNIETSQTIKTLIVKGKEHPMVALVLRGDDELNEVKAIKHHLVATPLTFIDEETIVKTLKAPIGSLGPVQLNIPVIADHIALAMNSFVCGANQADKHYISAAWDRDAHYHEAYDLRNVKEGDVSPDGKGTLHSCRGIEVGHVFQLGDKYAKAMNAAVINEQGHLQTMMMGCYGLGISRVVAATIEQHHDAQGIIWPLAIAPFQLVIIPINGQKSQAVREHAEELYQQFCNRGVDVLLDDRNERAGILFADNDLIGIPHRLVVSDRNLEQGCVEYKSRISSESQQMDKNLVVEFIANLINVGSA